MIQTVIALCLFIGGELIEHRIQPDISHVFKDEKRSNKKYGHE